MLAPDEVAGLDQALARLRVVKDGGLCPLHAPTVSLTTTGDVTREYHVADLCGGVPPMVGADATQRLVDVLLKATRQCCQSTMFKRRLAPPHLRRSPPRRQPEQDFVAAL